MKQTAKQLANLKKVKGFDKHPENINRNGRPRKYVSLLKEQGYSQSEVNDCIQVLLAMSLAELKEVYNNPKATALEMALASAIIKDIEKGQVVSIESVLNRAFGKPKQSLDVTSNDKEISPFSGMSYEQLYKLKYGKEPDEKV